MSILLAGVLGPAIAFGFLDPGSGKLSVHRSSNFLAQIAPVAGATPQTIMAKNPSDMGTVVFHAVTLDDLGINAPVGNDSVQSAYISNCYQLADLNWVGEHPELLKALIHVDTANPGYFYVTFVRGGVPVFVHIKGDIGSNDTRQKSGQHWQGLIEEAYAQIRTTGGTLAGLDYGSPNEILAAIGVPCTELYFANIPSDYATIDSVLAVGWGVFMTTTTTTSPLESSHCYRVIAADPVLKTVVAYNPWGGAFGTSLNPADGKITVSGSQVAAQAKYLCITTGTQQPLPTPPVIALPMPSPTPTPTPTPTLALTNIDIGSPAIAGGSTAANGQITITAAGADIYGSVDQFHFVYESKSGDATLIARVVSQSNSNAWAKSGLMFRSDSSAGASEVMIAITPENGVTMQWRTSAGGSTNYIKQIGITAPIWLKLVRTGNVFTAFESLDGIAWKQVSTVTLTMPTYALAGLAVTSHNAMSPSVAVFDSLQL